jgi:hypothetical protein
VRFFDWQEVFTFSYLFMLLVPIWVFDISGLLRQILFAQAFDSDVDFLTINAFNMQKSLSQDLKVIIIIGLMQALVFLVLDLTNFVCHIKSIIEPPWPLFFETKVIFGVE